MIGAAGWYYLFYSRAANRLAGIERAQVNRLRVRLRRINGLLMLLLGGLLLAAFEAVDAERTPGRFLAVWLGILGMLGAIVTLALWDVKLTWKLRWRDEDDKHS